MKLANLFRILGLSAVLATYSFWVVGQRSGAGPRAGEGVPATEIPLIRAAEAEALWRDGSAVFLDTRSAIDHAYGHIPGSVLLPEEEFEDRLTALRPRLERARALVVYCKSEDCGKSLWTALRLWHAGLKQVRIYPAGWNDWYLRGLPVRRTAER